MDRHVSNLYTNLDVSTRAAATAWAYEHGLAEYPFLQRDRLGTSADAGAPRALLASLSAIGPPVASDPPASCDERGPTNHRHCYSDHPAAPTSSSSAPVRPALPPATISSGSASLPDRRGRRPRWDVWRRRYDSLKLYSPASYDSLPGMPFPLPKRAFPTGREMADYLELYAGNFGLTVDTGVRIERLVAPLAKASRSSRPLVTALRGGPGHRGRRRVPAPAGARLRDRARPAIRQLHSSAYRIPAARRRSGPRRRASHSGADLAHEIVATHPVIVSGKSHGQIPVPLDSRRGRLGFSVFQAFMWHVATLDTPIGRKMAPEVKKGGGPLLRGAARVAGCRR